jgi:2-iminobutanoate/2-iminopropanoate deaminase
MTSIRLRTAGRPRRAARLALAALLAPLAGCAHHAPVVEYFPADGALTGQKVPFSPAVRVGWTLYLAGQIGSDSTGHLVSGGIQPETRQVLTNISRVLEQHGSSLDRVVKCTVFLADMKEWPAMNEVYATFFPEHFPARSAFGTTGLARGARVEIECIATVAKR